MRKWLRLGLLLGLSASAVGAVDWKALRQQGYVSDFANVIDAAGKNQLDAYCAAVERSTGDQIALVAVPSLEGEPIADVANTIYRGWGVGLKGKQEGILLLLAVGDQRIRLEIGPGLKAIVLRLRQKACSMLSDSGLLRRLRLDSVSTFCVLFRHALVLHGVDAPGRKRDVIERAQEVFGIDPQPFQKLLDIREERIKPRDVDPASLLASYLQGISVVIGAVNGLKRAGLKKADGLQ